MKVLKALEKPLGFFSLPVEGVEKSRWKCWKKPLGSFPLPVESSEKSCWENSSYPLLQRRKLTYLRFRLGVKCELEQKIMKFGSPTEHRRRRKKFNRF